MNITLHIEHLILDGVDIAPHRREQFRRALGAELGRLLSEGGLAEPLRSGSSFDELSGGRVELSGGATEMGNTVARAVYGGLGE